MYSGFITTKHVIKYVGVHQRFDMSAYRMIRPFLASGSFPTLKNILHFEGYNGPDGLKIKSPGVAEPEHLYKPHDGSGEVPMHIANHYAKLVECLQEGDQLRAAFEASWLAHYVCDGLTPAHHFPLSEEIVRAKELKQRGRDEGKFSDVAQGHWSLWGAKGHLSTHINFEMGVAFALGLSRNRVKLDHAKLAQARKEGPVEFFKIEAADIASLNVYEQFYAKGWTSDIARQVRRKIAPVTAQTIGIIWLLAYLEAGQAMVTGKK